MLTKHAALKPNTLTASVTPTCGTGVCCLHNSQVCLLGDAHYWAYSSQKGLNPLTPHCWVCMLTHITEPPSLLHLLTWNAPVTGSSKLGCIHIRINGFSNLRLPSSVNNWHLQAHMQRYNGAVRQWCGHAIASDCPIVFIHVCLLSANYSLNKAAIGYQNFWITVSVFWLVEWIDRYEST